MYAIECFTVIDNWHHISKRNDISGKNTKFSPFAVVSIYLFSMRDGQTRRTMRMMYYSSIFFLFCYSCNSCDSLFTSLMLLEHHKEEFEHWSDDELGRGICCRQNRCNDYFTDTESFSSEAESEDLERLL